MENDIEQIIAIKQILNKSINENNFNYSLQN